MKGFQKLCQSFAKFSVSETAVTAHREGFQRTCAGTLLRALASHCPWGGNVGAQGPDPPALARRVKGAFCALSVLNLSQKESIEIP